MFKKLFRPTFAKRIFFFIVADIVLSVFTVYLSYLLRFNFEIPYEYYKSMKLMMFILIFLKIIVFYFYKLYFVTWRFFGLLEYKKLIISHIWSYFIFTLIFLLFQTAFIPFPRSVILIDFFLSLFFIGFVRILKRVYTESKKISNHKRVLIYGANAHTLRIIKSFKDEEMDYLPVAIVSSDVKSIGTYLADIKVESVLNIKNIIKSRYITTIVIVEKLDTKEINLVVDKLHKMDIKDIKISQIFKDDEAKLKDVTVEDLLARKPKDLDKATIKNFIENKTVLITGAGGSIGSELSRQCLKYGATKLYLIDHSEYNLYNISEELNSKNIKSILQTVLDKKALEETFLRYKPDIVIHAAAYKHVPLVEENIEEAIKNNIIGTKNCIDLAIKYKVKKFIFISTDKAVRPTNVMGATKRVCELYAGNVASMDTEIVAVRFGNVLGSSGSVIPKFQKQIQNGGPVTVTHPEITRYFMLIPEACELVLQAGAIAKGGEIFILDMGEPVKIVDLAKKMCELSGKKDIKIEFVGLRAGEKLYEELLINESDKKTKYNSIMIAKRTKNDIDWLNKHIENLVNSKEKIRILKQIVPEFNHKD